MKSRVSSTPGERVPGWIAIFGLRFTFMMIVIAIVWLALANSVFHVV